MITVCRMHVLPDGLLGLGASSMPRMKILRSAQRTLAHGYMTSSQVHQLWPQRRVIYQHQHCWSVGIQRQKATRLHISAIRDPGDKQVTSTASNELAHSNAIAHHRFLIWANVHSVTTYLHPPDETACCNKSCKSLPF